MKDVFKDLLEEAVFRHLDASPDVAEGYFFSARDQIMAHFAMDRSTATALVAKYQQKAKKIRPGLNRTTLRQGPG